MKDYDRDSFWNIDNLVPKNKKREIKPLQRKKLVDYFVDTDDAPDKVDLTIEVSNNYGTTIKEDVEYTLEHSFIKRVCIKHIPDKVDFHANFLKAAHLYFEASAEECEYIPFYSYMPRYPQLNEKQKKYYFYWRENVRNGNYLKCDKSYLELLIYEIINLTDCIPPEDGVEQLIGLWCAYRERFPMMDDSFATWIRDYCLVNRIACPMDRLNEFIYKILSKLSFKEFFLGDICFDKDESVDALLYCLSDYCWQTGRYAMEEHRDIYKKHMLGAMRKVLTYLNSKGMLFNGNKTIKKEWRAFVGATVSSDNKYTIELSYVPLNTTPDRKATITAAVRYTENKLRMLTGVKSRLAVKGLDDEYKGIIDDYFKSLIERARQLKERASRPEYEELYEAENTELSFDDAENIEKESWITTARLVEPGDEPLPEITDDIEAPTEQIEEEKDDDMGADGDLLSNDADFIRAALDGDYTRMKEIANSRGELIDTFIERINEMFTTIIGDVIFDANDDGYSIIEDYKEDIEEWLRKM